MLLNLYIYYRVLESLTKEDLKKYLKLKKIEQHSFLAGVELLRMHDYNREVCVLFSEVSGGVVPHIVLSSEVSLYVYFLCRQFKKSEPVNSPGPHHKTLSTGPTETSPTGFVISNSGYILLYRPHYVIMTS